MITTGVLVVLAALLALGVDSIFRKGFGQLEQDWVSESARRVRTAHTGELDALERSATDYSAWTDTYDYMADPALPYVANNMAASMFANLKLDAFLIFEPSG
ncbi:MAG TPA: CHASE4 domain-containing protein, partial [Opitutus sp.]|nr:CHASE4 domain-containing protein [Opitutus sp.]